jgi:hypothetical protein
MANAHLRLVAPTTVNRTVPTPQRRPNRELRTREHLTTDEVERLIEAAKTNRVMPGMQDEAASRIDAALRAAIGKRAK